MQEPILEALTFDYQRMGVADNENEISRSQEGEYNTSVITQRLNKALENFNAVHSTPCPFVSCSFKVEGLSDPLCENFVVTQEFLKHFLVEHNLVIDNVAGIANLHKYLLHWGGVFSRPGFVMESVCVAFWMDHPMTSVENVQKDNLPAGSDSSTNSETRHKYYMLTDAVPEDKQLRSRLWSERLETVLEINRLEREQRDFAYKCPLFCKEVCTGNRANLFLHMAEEHAFHVGQPDNIVFVRDFLSLIEKELESLKCIYCEKTFKDRVTLKEHMRKKLHKRINPLNPEYDRFYMVNYLEVGKTWQALEQEDVEEERIEEDWTELKDETNQIICLICPMQLSSFEETLNHMNKDHGFDFNKIVSKYDFYQKVKIVNFIRRSIYQSRCFYCEAKLTDKVELIVHIGQHHQLGDPEFPLKNVWSQSELLFPTYENDQFLMFLGDDDEDGKEMETDTADGADRPKIIPEDLSDIKVPPVIQPPADLDLDLL